jgi:hypothetical protein
MSVSFKGFLSVRVTYTLVIYYIIFTYAAIFIIFVISILYRFYLYIFFFFGEMQRRKGQLHELTFEPLWYIHWAPSLT